MSTPAPTPRPRPKPPGSVLVAMVLAIGICTALNLFVFAVLYDAIFSAGPGLSENATQILSGWGGGIISIIGAVIGYQVGSSTRPTAPVEEAPSTPTPVG